MKLEKHFIDIKDAKFAEKTCVDASVLYVAKEELSKVAMDFRFESVDFELAYPGESCRLAYVGDCVQPMFKTGDEESTFPGVVDEIRRVGNGKSIFLRGISVTETLLMKPKITCGIDMSGPAAGYSPVLPKLIHLCILAKPAEGVKLDDYLDAVSHASKRVAKYLAEAAKDCKADEIEHFELKKDGLEGLPKVAYIFQIFSHAPLTDTRYYGDGCAKIMPIIVSPTEILDGALLNRDYYQAPNADPSYSYVNQPVILELMRRHGKDLNFVGVVLSNSPAEVESKRLNTMMCAGLVKYHLNADCAIISKEGGGHPQIDMGMCCDYCEELGVKTALLITEFLSAGNPITELVLFSTKNADAMVTNGCITVVNFPKMERVVGLQTMWNHGNTKELDSHGPFVYGAYPYIRGAVSQIGNSNFTSVVY